VAGAGSSNSNTSWQLLLLALPLLVLSALTIQVLLPPGSQLLRACVLHVVSW